MTNKDWALPVTMWVSLDMVPLAKMKLAAPADGFQPYERPWARGMYLCPTLISDLQKLS